MNAHTLTPKHRSRIFVALSQPEKAGGLPSEPSRSFELLGVDLLLDTDLKPWLIEVNYSPSLRMGSPLGRRVFHINDAIIHQRRLIILVS